MQLAIAAAPQLIKSTKEESRNTQQTEGQLPSLFLSLPSFLLLSFLIFFYFSLSLLLSTLTSLSLALHLCSLPLLPQPLLPSFSSSFLTSSIFCHIAPPLSFVSALIHIVSSTHNSHSRSLTITFKLSAQFHTYCLSNLSHCSHLSLSEPLLSSQPHLSLLHVQPTASSLSQLMLLSCPRCLISLSLSLPRLSPLLICSHFYSFTLPHSLWLQPSHSRTLSLALRPASNSANSLSLANFLLSLLYSLPLALTRLSLSYSLSVSFFCFVY